MGADRGNAARSFVGDRGRKRVDAGLPETDRVSRRANKLLSRAPAPGADACPGDCRLRRARLTLDRRFSRVSRSPTASHYPRTHNPNPRGATEPHTVRLYLPFRVFRSCAETLPDDLLHEQLLDCYRLAMEMRPDRARPAVLHEGHTMWARCYFALVEFGRALTQEAVRRGRDEPMLGFFRAEIQRLLDRKEKYRPPPWLGDVRMHVSHQSVMMRKHAAFVRWCPQTPIDLPPLWPVEVAGTVRRYTRTVAECDHAIRDASQSVDSLGACRVPILQKIYLVRSDLCVPFTGRFGERK